MARRIVVWPLVMIARIALVVMACATLADVAGRHAFGRPISGIVELVEFTLIWSAFPGIAVAFWTAAHVRVDVADFLLSERTIKVMDIITLSLMLLLMIGLAWLAVDEFRDKLDWGDRTVDLRIPLTWFWAAIVLGYAASALLLAVQVRLAARARRDPK